MPPCTNPSHDFAVSKILAAIFREFKLCCEQEKKKEKLKNCECDSMLNSEYNVQYLGHYFSLNTSTPLPSSLNLLRAFLTECIPCLCQVGTLWCLSLGTKILKVFFSHSSSFTLQKKTELTVPFRFPKGKTPQCTHKTMLIHEWMKKKNPLFFPLQPRLLLTWNKP